MLKNHWKLLTVTSIVTLLPILAGLILWAELPDLLPSHWNLNGEIDGWSSKPFVVFALPLILTALQWMTVLVTFTDPKQKNHSKKILGLVLWITPVLSIVLSALSYLTALGISVQIQILLPILVGILFFFIGNYLPKCKQSYTIGIKLPWTLHSVENWNRTHRFAGYLLMFGSIVMVLSGIFLGTWVFFGVMLTITLAPIVYSYVLHRKGI